MITISEKKKNSQVTHVQKGENLHWNIGKGGVNILWLLAKTQKQARAGTRNYNYFECDWLI